MKKAVLCSCLCLVLIISCSISFAEDLSFTPSLLPTCALSGYEWFSSERNRARFVMYACAEISLQPDLNDYHLSYNKSCYMGYVYGVDCVFAFIPDSANRVDLVVYNPATNKVSVTFYQNGQEKESSFWISSKLILVSASSLKEANNYIQSVLNPTNPPTTSSDERPINSVDSESSIDSKVTTSSAKSSAGPFFGYVANVSSMISFLVSNAILLFTTILQ